MATKSYSPLPPSPSAWTKCWDQALSLAGSRSLSSSHNEVASGAAALHWLTLGCASAG